MTFKDLRIGQSFDWLNDENPMFNSFYLTCTKISERRYQDEQGTIHRVGSASAKVYHVGKPTPQEQHLWTGPDFVPGISNR